MTTSISSASTTAISRLQIARYACAVGDFNPVHVDEDFALARGLPSVIAHGPLTASLVIDLIVGQCDAAALRSAAVRFKAPVFPGDVLTLVPTDGGADVVKADGSPAASVVLTWAPTA